MEPVVLPGPAVFVTVPFTTMVRPSQGFAGSSVPLLLQDKKNKRVRPTNVIRRQLKVAVNIMIELLRVARGMIIYLIVSEVERVALILFFLPERITKACKQSG
jgi:hypothetical protein